MLRRAYGPIINPLVVVVLVINVKQQLDTKTFLTRKDASDYIWWCKLSSVKDAWNMKIIRVYDSKHDYVSPDGMSIMNGAWIYKLVVA